MGIRSRFDQAPTILKVAYGLFVLGVVVAAGGVITQSGLFFLPMVAAALFFGLVLLLDVRGAATGMAGTLKEPVLGIDYSRSFMATTAYARVFGGFMVLVACVMAGGILTELT